MARKTMARKTNESKKETKNENVVLKGENVEINIQPYEDGNFLGFATVIIYGFIKIYNCRVLNGTHGVFVALPQSKGTNGKYYSHCYIDPEDDDGKFISDEISALLDDWRK